MTDNEKLNKVLGTITNDKIEAIFYVKFIDWVTENDTFLKAIYPKFKKDFNTDIEFIAFAKLIYENELNEIASLN